MTLITKTGIRVYRLRDLKNGLFQIHVSDGPAYEGAQDVIIAAAINMGLDYDDLKFAVFELETTNHDYAEFGIFGRFIYTAKDKHVA